MLSFLFWNLNKKPIEQLVADAAYENDVDILILAECDIFIPTLLNALNHNQENQFEYCSSPNEKIKFIINFSTDVLHLVSDNATLDFHTPHELFWNDHLCCT